MPTELSKQYDPKDAQERWLKFWNERGYFHSDPPTQGANAPRSPRPFTIVIPPPNVTGALHMGHALNNTLQDVLIRWRRMQAYNTLWMPGTDHAGIATQAVVERLIFQQEKKTRHDLGREELVRRIWQWKDLYEARILGQLKQLGCSCDWRRTRFTFDEGCSRAVRQTFFDFFKAGLIYRGKRLVNWDTHLQTAVADDEIFHETVKGNFWTFKYPVKASGGRQPPGKPDEPEFIRFSTTRPETMLGDTAVAVHPDDPRYKHLIGKQVTVPLVSRDIPIIADAELVDPTLGTGAVKVTPAHDPNDYQCGLRHKLPMINILNPDGSINANGGKYATFSRERARERITEDMKELGLLEKVEDRDIDLAHSDRSKTPIEPYLSDQWFVRMGDVDGKPGLAQMTMDAVTSGQVKFHPERYANTYLDWLGEKRDWCISRQLWWGHRIPVWYPPAESPFGSFAELDKRLFELAQQYPDKVAIQQFESLQESFGGEELMNVTRNVILGPDTEEQAKLIESWGFRQDPDVLDTWFSSALWPFATLGWPEETPELSYYYPTDVLVTSRGIITLWVARMVLAGLFERHEVPFHDVYITPTILDGFGETMSKSKGNGVDPLDIIERYGTDALRFHMVYIATENQDSRMPVANVCPSCDTLIPVKMEHMYMRTRKVTCPSCKKPFRPGGPWPTEDTELPTAKQASEKFDMGRNFANKLWNAARFILMNLEGYTPGTITQADRHSQADPDSVGVGLGALPIEDRWILSRLATTAAAVTEQLEAYHFSEAARTIYDFTWSEFCDWYVEMSKSRLKPGVRSQESGVSEDGRYQVQRVLVGVLDTILRLLHPIMPFVTESIWQTLSEAAFERGLPHPEPAAESVMIASWPKLPDAWRDAGVERRIGHMQDLVRAIRNIRNQFMVNEKGTVDAVVRCDAAVAEDFQTLASFIQSLAKVGQLECSPSVGKPPQSATFVHPEFQVYVSLSGLIDIKAELGRQQKQKTEKEKQLHGIRAKLATPSFIERAPAEVVQQQRDQERELLDQLKAIEENIQQLEATV